MERSRLGGALAVMGLVTGTQARAEDCDLHTGTAVDGIRPVFIACEWTDVDADAVRAVLSNPSSQARVFGGLTESTVVDRKEGVTRVRQRFQASPAADREVVIDYREVPIDSGTRYVWRKSADQSALRGDAVEVVVHEGAWEVHEQGDTVRVTYELRVALGGMLPPFITSWAQGGAIEQTLAELQRIGRRD